MLQSDIHDFTHFLFNCTFDIEIELFILFAFIRHLGDSIAQVWSETIFFAKLLLTSCCHLTLSNDSKPLTSLLSPAKQTKRLSASATLT